MQAMILWARLVVINFRNSQSQSTAFSFQMSIESYNMKTKSLLINLELRVCDVFKQQWARDFLNKYSDFLGCPIPPVSKFYIVIYVYYKWVNLI